MLAPNTIIRFPTNINLTNPNYVLGRIITNSELVGFWHEVFLRYIRYFRSTQFREIDIIVLIFRAL